MSVESDLFAAATESLEPLAARMRPQSLDEVVGQTHLLGAGQPLRRAIESNTLHSFILWGPPGVGKTTLARLVSVHSDALFLQLSAVFSGVKDIRSAIDQAREAAARSCRSEEAVHKTRRSQYEVRPRTSTTLMSSILSSLMVRTAS